MDNEYVCRTFKKTGSTTRSLLLQLYPDFDNWKGLSLIGFLSICVANALCRNCFGVMPNTKINSKKAEINFDMYDCLNIYKSKYKIYYETLLQKLLLPKYEEQPAASAVYLWLIRNNKSNYCYAFYQAWDIYGSGCQS